MKMPSRKTITAIIFFTFFILFFGLLIWYFGAGLLNQNTSDFDDSGESRGFTFFPFGRGGTEIVSTDPDDTVSVGGDTGNLDIPDGEFTPEIDRLRLVSDVPTAAGFVFRKTANRDSLLDFNAEVENGIRYIEVETGHVYETTDRTLANTRLTNTTIPRIQEATFVDADSLIVRYVDPASDVVKTFSATISEEQNQDTLVEGAEAVQKLTGIFLPDNIVNYSINGERDFLYTQANGTGMVAIVSDLTGQDKQQIFSSSLAEWKPDWRGREETITMTHYPSSVSYGMSQILNRTTQRVTPFISGELALDVLLSPDGSRALVSYRTNTGISLFVRQTDGSLEYTGLDTMVEKCVWSSDSVLAYCAVPLSIISNTAPDTWYQGLEVFTDDMWRINTQDVTTSLLFSAISDEGYALDIIDLGLSLDEKFMYFRDKQNLFFWTYQLELN